ncbi:MAG TPA: hypothetical protein DCZ92_00235 [Elusimicrobia bacterium]|nr:MAG: hypothetical protein A2016_09595 [Elusimicrobia bacterium GWF2_62_30]HBA59254.1 hypothetical protein [Elusimicrobiota bacterium]
MLRLAAAALVGGAWTFHVAEVRHAASEDGCLVCAVSVSPELNSDCGCSLLAQPESFVLKAAALPGPLPESYEIPAFLGRAPPAA